MKFSTVLITAASAATYATQEAYTIAHDASMNKIYSMEATCSTEFSTVMKA